MTSDTSSTMTFQPTLLREERRSSCSRSHPTREFQPTLLREERQRQVPRHRGRAAVPTHAPARGATHRVAAG